MTNGVCFYNEKDFKGRVYCFDNSTQLATVPSSKWSAIRVIGNGAVRIYKSSHYGGDQRNVMASAFQLHGMNDAIRSIKVYARNTRSFACMYDHDGFRGDVHCLAAGQTESNLKNIGYNDATSSMYVSGDVNVKLYKDANFSGSNNSLNKSTSDFHSRPGGWLDDDISSWKVELGQKSDQDISIYLQEKLGQDARIDHTTIMGSHNSTNSAAYNNAAGIISPNQQRSIHEQLDMGVRFFEFDTHDKKDDDIALCHAVDCDLGLVQSMKRISTEIADWLYNNPESFVFMYLNDYAANEKKLLIKEILQDTFGSLLHRPNGCQDMTPSLNQKTLLNQGKQIVVWTDSGCVQDAAFDQNSFWSSHDVRGNGKTFTPNQFVDGKFSRAYECDHPTCTDVLNESQAHEGLLAGLNSIAQDQLVENGKSLYHLWGLDYNTSWQPLFYGDSALAFNKTGWFRLSLVAQSTKLYPICQANDRWVLGARQVTFAQSPGACRDAGANFDYPTYIIEAEAVRRVLEANGINQVYINFGKHNNQWGSL